MSAITSIVVCGVATTGTRICSCINDKNFCDSLIDVNPVPYRATNVTPKPQVASKILAEPKVDIPSVMRKIINSGQEEGFYVCNVSEIIRRYRLWKAVMPRVETFYAVKCNYSKIVLETLAVCGSGFDCASMDEIKKMLSLGVSPDKIIFAHPTKKISHILFAREHNITNLTFDSESELYKTKKYYPEARLVLRIKYDDVTARYVLGKKYGVNHKTEVEPLLNLAWSLGLNVVGVSFHIGSSMKNFQLFAEAIEAARDVFNLGSEIGFDFDLLDIGGGISGNKHFELDKVGVVINEALDKFFPEKHIKIIAEPGRYYVDAPFTLVSCIHSKRLTKWDGANNDEDLRMYYVDVNIYNSLISCLFQEYYVIHPLDDGKAERSKVPTIIWGSTCDSSDILTEGVEHLPEMEEGEWVVFEDTGAYSTSIACQFNGFPLPDLYSVISEEDRKFLTEASPRLFPRSRFLTSKYDNLENFLQNEGNKRHTYFEDDDETC